MALSKKLTAMDELMSCDPLYLAKVSIRFPSPKDFLAKRILESVM